MSPGPVDRALAQVTRAGACAADAVLFDVESREVRVRGDEIDFVKQAREKNLSIRAFVKAPEGLRSAITSTSDLSDAAVDRMARETVELARATEPDPHAGLPDGDFAPDLPDLALLDPADRTVPLEVRIDDARRAERAARAADPRIVNSEGSEASSRFACVELGNTAGFRGTYESARHGLYSAPLARENGSGSMQTDYWMTAARTLGDLEAPERVGAEAARRALRRLGSRQIDTTEVPIVFEPMTARSLVGHVAAAVGGGAIYRKASFLAERLGETIASPLVTIVDEGRRPGGLGSRPFDGEGLPTRRNVVVEQGALRSFLVDSYAGRKLGLPATGSAARGAGGGPSPGPTNFWMETGSSSLDEMIATTERGFLVTWLFGHGFNAVTGDFSRGAAGIWIENGALTHPVDEVTIAGNLGELLQSIDAVGDDLEWLGSTAAPSFRVTRLTVAGR
jgi:PmbA protein